MFRSIINSNIDSFQQQQQQQKLNVVVHESKFQLPGESVKDFVSKKTNHHLCIP